jgi:hypothetical protein
LPDLLQPNARRSDLWQVARCCAALALVCLLGGAGPALGASALRLPFPTEFGEFEGETLDPEGARLGRARVSVARDPQGRIVVEGERGISGRESTRYSALLEPVAGGAGLRPLLQHTLTVDAQGATLTETVVDHASGQGTCTTDGKQETVELAPEDRVSIASADLLLAPLAREERDEVTFQTLICAQGLHLVDVSARRTGRVVRPSEGTQVVEIEYKIKLNPIMALIARPFLPRILFWIDPAVSGPSVAQQLPLFPRGPTVFVVRRGIAPGLFLAN